MSLAVSSPLSRDSRNRTLARAWRDHGDIEARNALIAENRGFAISVASKYAKKYRYSFDEAKSHAFLGLIHATRRYDPDRFAFTTYAKNWIWSYIARGHHGDTAIHIPAYVRDGGKMKGEESPPFQPKTISSKLNDYTMGLPGCDDSPLDQIADAEIFAMRLAEASRQLADLREVERVVITHRFGLDGQPPETLKAIGARIGLTYERVRQIEVAAMATMKARCLAVAS